MKQYSRYAPGFFAIAIFIATIFAFINRVQITDYLALRNYQPSERIIALANDTTMDKETRRVFYSNHPELSNKTEFRNKCTSAEQSIVLGCYIQREGIFLLNVEEPRLAGVIEVTAAHEVLHAHYDRLSSGERKRIDKLTADFFAGVSDERIKRTVEQYRAKGEEIVPNELHSILATEIRELSPELEAYYGQYFSNRQQIVSFSEKYEHTFIELTGQVEAYDKQLAELKSEIESNQMEIEGRNQEIEAHKARLDSMINNGRTEEYNAAVPGFNADVNAYNSLINRTRDLIAQYNEIVEKRNEIATTEKELVEAINSNVLPQQTE